LETLLIDHGHWAELVMNRPERKNAITGPLGRDMTACLQEVDGNHKIQALVLRGEGGAFCSGLDLDAFNADPAPDWMPEFQQIWRGVHKGLFNCRVPIIGALQRYAINGGAALALACDFLIAGEDAFLQVGEVQIGMAAPYNLAWLALRQPEHVSARLAMTGRRFNGVELASLGIATESVNDDQVLDAARTLCETLASFPEGANARIKKGIAIGRPDEADAWFDQFTQTRTGAAAPTRMSSVGSDS